MSIRRSKRRDLILDVLKGTRCHPTADWIYDQARKKLHNISLGTVYRNLKVLAELGEIQELCYGNGSSRFDAITGNHYHMRCQSCGGVFDIDTSPRRDIDRDMERQTGFAISYHRLEFLGFCPACQKAGPRRSEQHG